MRTVSNHKIDSIRRRLERLYQDRAPLLMQRLQMVTGRYGVRTGPETPGSLWDENDVVLITYADTVSRPGERPLNSLLRFLTRRTKGAINTVHLLPFYPWSSDDGFSVIDYREVKSEYGTWADIDAFGKSFKLMFDLVLNHCSSQSQWFKDYVSSIAPARHYFIEVNPDADLTTVVRPRPSPVLTKARTRDGTRHVWTTFSADQVDLDFSNPDVLFEFIEILLLYISHGAKIIRLDAIAFLWKTLGTSCIHLPETHEVVKLLRDLIDCIAPDVILLTETNVPHSENISYFGDGDEAHMVYQFTLPPLLLHALLKGTSLHLTRWAGSLGTLPPGCTYFNFTASHDGIGVRPLEGILEQEELTDLVNSVLERGGRVSTRAQSDGSQKPYELNISYFDALSDPEDSGVGIDRFLCSQAVMLAMKGIPGIYFHSLTGTRNDYESAERTGENRAINRAKWDLDALKQQLDDSKSPHSKIFSQYLRMLRRRNRHPAFHPDGTQQVVPVDPAVFAFIRVAPDHSETITCLFNLSHRKISLPKASENISTLRETQEYFEILTAKILCISPEKPLTLQPYQPLWLLEQRGKPGRLETKL